MKKTILLLCLPAALALCGLFAMRAEKSALLRLNLQNGASYLYTNTISQNVATQMGGQPVQLKLNMQSVMNLQVTEKDADSLTMKAAYSHMALDFSAMGRNSTFNSDSSGGRFGNLFSILQSHPVTLRTDGQGNIGDIRGLAQLRSALKAALPSTGGVSKIFDNMLNDNTFVHSFDNLGLFPARPVSVGDHWQRDASMYNMVATKVHATYVVKDITADKVVLDVTGDIVNAADSADVYGGMRVPVKIAGTLSGVYTVDRSTGLLTGDLQQKMKESLSIMGQDMVMDIDGKSHLDEALAR